MYRERNRIERMIGHLMINRAIATRYDRLARSFLAALHIAAIRRCLRYATLQSGPSFELCRRLQSIRAKTCSRFAKNCCHPPLAPW
jgi:hypothetical protein